MLSCWVAIAGCALIPVHTASLPPHPHGSRAFGELTLSHHAMTGVSAYAIDPTATDGGSHLLYDGTVGVTLSNEPQLLEVNLVRSNGSPALTGHSLVDMLPQPSILSMQEHFVASGRQVLPLTGVADLEPGDLVGVAHAPLLSCLLYTSPSPRDQRGSRMPSSA